MGIEGQKRVIIPGAGKRPLTVEEKQVYKPSLLLRELADFGYTKVSRLGQPGEFRYLGDVIDIFPLGMQKAWRIEFWGNDIERIEELEVSQDFSAFEKNVEERVKKSFLQNLSKGDYVVHADHGIGKFMEKRVIEAESYIILEYAKGDKLFVPEKVRQKITPYIGFGRPKVNRLNTISWASTKRRVNEETLKLAKELLTLYAKRTLSTRPPYRTEGIKENLFLQAAGFTFTKDQLRAIEDIKKDLKGEKPMDRLVCGDVGFGKTEVALEAAFQVIAAGKQVVLLTPTTILADQHYHYIKKRFTPFGITTALISRTTKETEHLTFQNQMVVGTHKVLSRLDELEHLGMVIIDEEQKFGVKQKEKVKELRTNVDMLSLSATPIPRTFQLALAGLRDISNILTPLPGKEPVLTSIFPFDENKVKNAIEKEIGRGGQVYYLIPRIKDIPRVEKLLKKLFGTALSFRIAHGKLGERLLIKTIHDFRDKAFQLLIATTIIENGLDLEYVNTLIVEDAQRLGLAQAHQIRGRVGRKHKGARAYFFFNPKKITEEGKERLRMLRRFQGLSQNYEIALKDLEIRGAGSILGKEQSGNIRAVGLHLYAEMLKEAVSILSSKASIDTGIER